MRTKTKIPQLLMISLFLLYASISFAEEIIITPKTGELFTLLAGQSARIMGIQDEVIFKCSGFNSSNSGNLATREIFATFIINGEVVEDSSKLHYDAEMIESDFKTFAKFIIWRPETRCEATADVTLRNGHEFNDKNNCWTRLATRFSDITICNNITNAVEQTICIESVLEKQQNPEGCNQVNSPRLYCRYVEATTTLNPQQCIGIIKTDYYRRCLKEISRRTNEGDKICESLPKDKPSYVEDCKDIINGTAKPRLSN